MKVFLDDVREAPDGWVRAYWPNEVITLLRTGAVTEISLDHDLGNDERGTGYSVLVWIEEQVFLHGMVPPAVHVHSANSSAKLKMSAALQSIRQHSSRSK